MSDRLNENTKSGAKLALGAAVLAFVKFWNHDLGAWLRDRDSAKTEPETRPVPQRVPDTRPPPFFVDDPDIDFDAVDSPKSKKNYFSQAELECRGTDCGCPFPGMDKKIMDIMNHFREETGPVIVNSAYRCPDWNRIVGGAENSKHVRAMAMDVVSTRLKPAEVYQWFDERYPNTLGIGRYDRFTHIDSREAKARWDNRTAAMVP